MRSVSITKFLRGETLVLLLPLLSFLKYLFLPLLRVRHCLATDALKSCFEKSFLVLCASPCSSCHTLIHLLHSSAAHLSVHSSINPSIKHLTTETQVQLDCPEYGEHAIYSFHLPVSPFFLLTISTSWFILSTTTFCLVGGVTRRHLIGPDSPSKT